MSRKDTEADPRGHWLREYGRSVGRGWSGGVFLGCTILGGLGAFVYLIRELNADLLVSILAPALAFSLAWNVRQAFAWKVEREARRRACDREETYAAEVLEAREARDSALELQRAYREQAESAQRKCEEEEQSWWTDDGLAWGSHEIAPTRMGEPPGLEVSVRSEIPVTPIRLRFWFSDEVGDDPKVTFKPDRDEVTSRRVMGVFRGQPVTVHPGGRVDVEWDTSSPISGAAPEVLDGESHVTLSVYSTSPDKPLRILNVQRRYRVS